MVKPTTVQAMGDFMKIIMDDGSVSVAHPGTSNLWIVSTGGGGGPGPGPGGVINPWGPGVPSRDDWESHASYSAGGYDWSGAGFGEGDPIVAPGAGTLRTSGGSGEYAAGNIGSAGLRSILILDSPVNRLIPKSNTLMNGSTREAEGPMAAIVFQHQSRFASEGHYNQLEACGYVGRTGNNVLHLHVHGLDAEGRRVDFYKFCP